MGGGGGGGGGGAGIGSVMFTPEAIAASVLNSLSFNSLAENRNQANLSSRLFM